VRVLTWAWLLGVVGCGMPQSEFIVSYTESFCEHKMTCADAAELTFEGILTQEDCVLQEEKGVSLWGLGCKFRASDAQNCLDDMALLTCPAAVGQLSDPPLSCGTVFFACETVDTTADTDAPAAEETDAP
jgi:hypothetical protein